MDDGLHGSSCPWHREDKQGCLTSHVNLESLPERASLKEISLEALIADETHEVWGYIIDYMAQACMNTALHCDPKQFRLGGLLIDQRPDLVAKVRERLVSLLHCFNNLVSRYDEKSFQRIEIRQEDYLMGGLHRARIKVDDIIMQRKNTE